MHSTTHNDKMHTIRAHYKPMLALMFCYKTLSVFEQILHFLVSLNKDTKRQIDLQIARRQSGTAHR